MIYTKKILITGGPGSGKTSLINELSKRNFNCEHEIVRSLTLEGKKRGNNQPFLKNPLKFTNELLDLRIIQFNKIQNNIITFYDRGVHDTLAYLSYVNIDINEDLIKKCKKIKYDLIFALSPWEKIYKKDECRYENFDESKKIFNHIIKIYKYFKMDIIVLKQGTIDERVKEILSHIKQK
jgi:predicted ATPase